MNMQADGRVSPVHVIRLRAPWDCQIDREFQDEAGRSLLVCSRRFGRPTNLTVNERVDLVISNVDGLDSIALNSDDLISVDAGAKQLRIDITQYLEPRNELTVNVLLMTSAPPAIDSPPTTPWDDEAVRLEIRTMTGDPL